MSPKMDFMLQFKGKSFDSYADFVQYSILYVNIYSNYTRFFNIPIEFK